MPPTTSVTIPFDALIGSDLILEATYEGGRQGNTADDPLGKLLPVGNQGGFRYRGSVTDGDVKLIVLYTSGGESDWPDLLDPVTGDFTYYGDNRKPGSELHKTARKGNLLLREIFHRSHVSQEERLTVPPILLFEKAGRGRDVIFRGLLAPGSRRLSEEEELVAIWRTTRHHRFQNYRAHFTVLDVPRIHREWIDDILAGNPLSRNCPAAWRHWVRSRIYHALEAPKTLQVRSKVEQLPVRPADKAMLAAIHHHFIERPHDFEYFAVDCWLAQDPHVGQVDVTRPNRDGGRDAVGSYLIGPASDPIAIAFALEAKCYAPGRNSVGVREVSRLISRIKHRDFGVLVTTAHVNEQAYREVREDAHPIVFITGADIIQILNDQGIRTMPELRRHLENTYPTTDGITDPHPVAAGAHVGWVGHMEPAIEVALPLRHSGVEAG